MVSFNSLLLAATLAVACNGYSHHGLHRRAQLHPRHFSNGTTTEPSYPIGTGVEEPPVEYPEVEEPTQTPDPTDSPATTTTCITEIETKTYTYTLGNGNAITTCVTQTHVVTKTISVSDVPAPTGFSQYPQEPTETVAPTESFSSTTTSTTTHVVTLTRPQSEVPTHDAGVNEVPSCSPVTVYITVPQSVVTVTVSATPDYVHPTVHTELPAPSEESSAYPEPPVHTEEPSAYPEPPVPTTTPITSAPYQNSTAPYSNSTIPSTTSTRYVTVVPVPYE